MNSYAELPPVQDLDPNDIYYNPNDPDGNPFYFDEGPGYQLDFAQVIAADVAGALGGAAGSILADVFHHHPIDWAGAGAWAIGGAIGGSSVGGIYKLIKWLF